MQCAWHAGTDVARKMVILGRECGLAIEMQQVTVQSLVPPQLADAKSAEEFMQQLPQVISKNITCLLQTNAAFMRSAISGKFYMLVIEKRIWLCLAFCLCLPVCLLVGMSASSRMPVHTCPSDLRPIILLSCWC